MEIHESSNLNGFAELEEQLKDILKNIENTEDVLEIGAKDFVKDLLKLPKPISQIKRSGYTHMVDTFTYRHSPYKKGEVEVGWGKYYGRMVEKGTVKSKRQAHLEPTFEKNKNKYYKKMIRHMGLD